MLIEMQDCWMFLKMLDKKDAENKVTKSIINERFK